MMERDHNFHEDDVFEARLHAALRRKPLIPALDQFSASVLARARVEAPHVGAPRPSAQRVSWGKCTAIASLLLLLFIMFVFARRAPGPVPAIAEWTLASEFTALLFGLIYLRRLVS